MSTLIFEPVANVPSGLRVKLPCAPAIVMIASFGAGKRTSCSRTRTVARDAASTVQVIAFACGAAVTTAVAVGVAVGASLWTVGAGDGVDAPPHALSRSSATAATRLATGTVTNTHDPRHLRMDAAVICVYAHLIECDGRALAAVEPDIERPALIARGHGVEFLAHVHELDRCAGGHAQLLRRVRPRGFPADRLDDLDLVRAHWWYGGRAATCSKCEQERARGGAEDPTQGHDDRTCVVTLRMCPRADLPGRGEPSRSRR